MYVYRAKSPTTYFATLAPKRRSPRKATTREIFDMPCALHHASRLASNNVAECACSQTRCALPQQASCSKDCTCEFPHENRLLPLISLRRRAHEFIVQRGENYKVSLSLGRSTQMSSRRLRRLMPTVPAIQYFTFIYQQGCSLAQSLPRQPDRT